MRLWRLVNKKHKDSPLSGEGHFKAGSRWASKGKYITYCSENASLTLAESMVHLTPTQHAKEFALVEIEVPDDLEMDVVNIDQLPENWQRLEQPSELQVLGDAWYQKGETLMLKIPSAVVPVENNYLLNTEHNDMKRITVFEPQEFALDIRLREILKKGLQKKQ